ncbi:MAG TPA: EAL domain-containing protein [Usitatibacter sp.]|nr:EAL domain-containing protein [Usitatibacter sp.]
MNPPRASQRRALSRLVEPVVAFPLLAAMLLAVIWGTTWSLVRSERAAARSTASASTVELAETYEAQVLRALREIDQTLRFVKYAHESNGGRIDLAALKNKGLLLTDLLFVVSIADARGDVTAGTRALRVRNVGADDYFTRQRAGDAIVIGKPIPPTFDDEWTLRFSRPLRDERGNFAGIVFVSVAASYFVSGYESSRLGSEGVLALAGNDGVFLARRSGEVVTVGEPVAYRALVGNTDPKPAAIANPWDGVHRYTVAREFFEFPAAVVTGLSEDEQLAPAKARARVYAWRAALGSAGVLFFIAGLMWLSWQLARVRRESQAALLLRNRAIESSVNAILILDAKKPLHPIDYVNPAFERMTGYVPEEAIGRQLDFLLGAERDQPGMKEIDRAMRERTEGHAVLRSFRRDGTLFWNEFYVAPVRDDAGRVTHYVGVMNDVTEAKEYEKALAHQASYDGLTDLANRNLLQDRLAQAIAQARRNAGAVAAVFLDVDNFKFVNDSLGHSVGDEMLRVLAQRLRSSVRESDTVARVGGDEFVLVLAGKAPGPAFEADITALMDKLLTRVAGRVVLREREVRPTCSIGVAMFPQDGDDAGTLLRNADAAMYRAKELGRNRFQFFTADVHERIRRRMELETSLRLALEREEFELHYQPQVGLRGGTIIGVEALIRWRHPERGLVYPGEFIGFAEETGLIVPIGRWVLEEACRQNKAWQDEGLARIPVAVNMSARQCEQPDVHDVVARALLQAGLAPEFLELEITESISMADPSQSVPLMRRLKNTGVTLSIDDFGTGFSNLSYLRRFPVDRLKIDLSFVREITSDPGSLAISEAIITMSHSLNLQVVAEGVETQGQLDLLGARDCDFMQGYLFSPPLTAADFARLLREDRRLPQAAMRPAAALT